jgi:hypothetical protein
MFGEVPENCLYDYVRVSSKSQEGNSSLEFQKQELFGQGVPEKNIRVEVGSTADPIQERPVLFNLIENDLKENDLLIVTKIDQCRRNTLYFLKLQEKIFKELVTFISLDLPHSSDMAVNKLISTQDCSLQAQLLAQRTDKSFQFDIKLVFLLYKYFCLAYSWGGLFISIPAITNKKAQAIPNVKSPL